MTEKDAKDFFAQKIISAAGWENIPFDDLERKMLYWSAEHEDAELQEKFSSLHDEVEYEKKVQRLLRQSFARDLKENAEQVAGYKDAYMVLSQGDHYLLVMLNDSIGNKLRKFSFFGGLDTRKEFLDFFQYLKPLLKPGKSRGKAGLVFRIVIGLVSLCFLYLPILAFVQHGTRDFSKAGSDSNFLKILTSFGLILGFICYWGEATFKYILPWWMWSRFK
ncbi:MAG TPA: hypothetical protein VHE12_07995 [bacterium]|nr:hypothetical protein [bacterium]